MLTQIHSFESRGSMCCCPTRRNYLPEPDNTTDVVMTSPSHLVDSDKPRSSVHAEQHRSIYKLPGLMINVGKCTFHCTRFQLTKSYKDTSIEGNTVPIWPSFGAVKPGFFKSVRESH